MLNWSKQFSTFCFLDNHQYQLTPHSQECLLAAGVRRSFGAQAGNALKGLQHFIDENKTWLFGHLSYDLKQELGFTPSRQHDELGFPDLFFFEPEVLIRLNETTIEITADDPSSVHSAILSQPSFIPKGNNHGAQLKHRTDKEEYISIIRRLKEHILRGDCYEINFCQELHAIVPGAEPLSLYDRLTRISPNPFSALYRMDHRWLICASPERFLCRQGDRILSQPIKGTSRRFEEVEKDETSRRELQESAKDRSENVMIVDLVRNDLSRICQEGTVEVDELYGIYSFPQVHQMISTVSGKLKNEISFTEIIRSTFPMGSMTGAPKKRVVELIEQYEPTRRGIFSGAVGYINPTGDFDFNVVIRSMMYNANTGYLSFPVGSGITFYSDPELEWEECLAKAEAVRTS